MVTAEKINKLAYLSMEQLEQALDKNVRDPIKVSHFIGITNGGQFCYDVLYFDTDKGEDSCTKVFVDLDIAGRPVAQY